ncbi:MAG: Bax inhibitor-1/YccA family protein [Candidatus Nanopelagicaceae bacterium]
MESSNPVLNRYNRRGYASMGNPNVGTTGYGTSYDAVEGGQLEDLYNAPAASSMRTGRMTMDDVVTRTSILFAVLLVTGAFAWSANLGRGALFGSLIGATVLGMVIAFSRKVRPALIMVYAALEGIVLGTISAFYEEQFQGIVQQALIATAVAFAGVLFAYRSGKISISARATKIATGAIIGYLILGVINLIGGNFIFNGTFGPLVAIFGVGLATFFLTLDFDQAAKAVAIGVPQEESWRVGFGMMVSVVWLYLEVLRLLSILRNDR